VGSIELFRLDAALVDPRLDPGPSPLRGVMWNEKDIVVESKETQRVGVDLSAEGGWGEEERGRGGDLSVRFYSRFPLIENRVLRVMVDYIRPGTSSIITQESLLLHRQEVAKPVLILSIYPDQTSARAVIRRRRR